MNFKQFQKALYESVIGCDVKHRISYYGYVIIETADKIIVNGKPTRFKTIKEAKQSIDQEKTLNNIDLYEDTPQHKIADIIRKHHNVKVTDTLIESYVDLAASKTFTTDQVAQDIRKTNKLDRILEGCIDYKLDDGSVVVIKEETQRMINSTLEHHQDVVRYMRESKENFLETLDQLKD